MSVPIKGVEEPYPKWVGTSYMLEPRIEPSTDPTILQNGGTRGSTDFFVPKEGQESVALFRYMDNNNPEGTPFTNEQHQHTEFDIRNGRTAPERD